MQHLNGGGLGDRDFELMTFVIIRRNQRWLDLGLGFTRNGTQARFPSSSIFIYCEQKCPLAGGASGCLTFWERSSGCLTFWERSSLMGFRLLLGSDVGISLTCETFAVPRWSHSRGDVGLLSMLLIKASWGFLLIDNSDGSCAVGWFKFDKMELFFRIWIGRTKILFCDGKINYGNGTGGRGVWCKDGIVGRDTGWLGGLFGKFDCLNVLERNIPPGIDLSKGTSDGSKFGLILFLSLCTSLTGRGHAWSCHELQAVNAPTIFATRARIFLMNVMSRLTWVSEGLTWGCLQWPKQYPLIWNLRHTPSGRRQTSSGRPKTAAYFSPSFNFHSGRRLGLSIVPVLSLGLFLDLLSKSSYWWASAPELWLRERKFAVEVVRNGICDVSSLW